MNLLHRLTSPKRSSTFKSPFRSLKVDYRPLRRQTSSDLLPCLRKLACSLRIQRTLQLPICSHFRKSDHVDFVQECHRSHQRFRKCTLMYPWKTYDELLSTRRPAEQRIDFRTPWIKASSLIRVFSEALGQDKGVENSVYLVFVRGRNNAARRSSWSHPKIHVHSRPQSG